jgi:hypothetical protein
VHGFPSGPFRSKNITKKFNGLIKIAPLDLKSNHPVMKALKIEQFKPAKDKEHDTIRRASKKNR